MRIEIYCESNIWFAEISQGPGDKVTMETPYGDNLSMPFVRNRIKALNPRIMVVGRHE